MKINLKLAVLFLSTALMAAGCGTLPIDTLNKRIAAFEISYEQVLLTVDRWIDEGRLVGDAKKKIQDQIREARLARLAIYIAKESGDFTTAQGKLTAATAALQIIRDHIANQEAMQPQTRLNQSDDGIYRWHHASLKRQGVYL